MIRTYVISLKDSVDRRRHTLRQIEPYVSIFDVCVIDAYDGRSMTDKDLNIVVDQDKAISIYGRKILGPEIGCTLSHRKCLDAIIKNNDQAAIVFEDDLVLPSDKLKEIKAYYELVSLNSRPILLLLSGDYWYTSIKKTELGVKVAKVREGVCSHAYIINQSAAKIICDNPTHYLADDWFSVKGMGVSILAAFPHIADQNRRDLKTEISEDYVGFIRKNLSTKARFYSYYRAIVKRLLLYTGRFESKSFI